MKMPVFLKLLIASKTRKQRSPNTSKPILITPWLEKTRTWIFLLCLHGLMGRKNGPSGREGAVSGAFISLMLPLVNPIFLRTLLTKVKGAVSFEVLRTINGVVHDTFKSACIALGLYDSDDEWNACLGEVVVMQTCGQL